MRSARREHDPLAIGHAINGEGSNPVIPLAVESIKTYTNRAFQNMRLVSQSQGNAPSVKVDIVPERGVGRGANFVQIWILVEADVIYGVFSSKAKRTDRFPTQQT